MNLLTGIVCGVLALVGGILLGRSSRTGSEREFAWSIACLIGCLLLIFSVSLA